MLVEFNVQNYKSIAEKQKFSMSAGKGKSDKKAFSFSTGNSLAPNILTSACIFGPNGVGKSSLIEALSFFRRFIISSAKDSQEGEEIEVTPFKLCEELKESPSEFEIVFIFNEHLYQYGFSVNETRVIDEWLFVRSNKPRTRLKEIFQRNFNEETKSYDWDLDGLKGQKEVWKNATRDNALFLSTAIMLRSEALQEPFIWLRWHLRVIKSLDRITDHFTIQQISSEDKKELILDILKATDLGIADIEVSEISSEDKAIQKNIVTELSNFFKTLEKVNQSTDMKVHVKGPNPDELSSSQIVHVQAIHKNRSGKNTSIDFDEESDGTKIIFSLAGPLIDVLDSGYTLFVDELHNSLHPHALRFIIGLFINPEINKNGAQLVFTSHETSVMARNFLHRDQIWLMEKEQGATCLFPLSDFKVREYEAFQKAYLDGRYGAIPRIGEFGNG